jgi:hypothetical protein
VFLGSVPHLEPLNVELFTSFACLRHEEGGVTMDDEAPSLSAELQQRRQDLLHRISYSVSDLSGFFTTRSVTSMEIFWWFGDARAEHAYQEFSRGMWNHV